MNQTYKEVQGVLFKKYRNILGKHVFILEKNGVRTKIFVGKALFAKAELNTDWTIGHIEGKLVNIRPGFCKNS